MISHTLHWISFYFFFFFLTLNKILFKPVTKQTYFTVSKCIITAITVAVGLLNNKSISDLFYKRGLTESMNIVHSKKKVHRSTSNDPLTNNRTTFICVSEHTHKSQSIYVNHHDLCFWIMNPAGLPSRTFWFYFSKRDYSKLFSSQCAPYSHLIQLNTKCNWDNLVS